MSNSVSSNLEIRRFFKKIAKENTLKPRYLSTWESTIFLNYLEFPPTKENLSLESITKKLVTLLALVTAQRVQTLSKIKISNIKKVQIK